jgi:hypothetical protein
VDEKRTPLSSERRARLVELRNGIALARALLDMVEWHLPLSLAGGDTAIESLSTQLADELARLARELVVCAGSIAPGPLDGPQMGDGGMETDPPSH